VKIETAGREPDITMVATFDAPRDLVWTAFTTPEHVVRWYGGKGFTNPVCEMDVRPGGRWRHVMRTPEGAEHHLAYVFVEVVRPERLSWRTDEARDGAPSALSAPSTPATVNTLTLEDLGARTRITFVARFPTLAERDLALTWGFTTHLGEGVERMRDLLATLTKEH
jgi:uncharacterized protein YndB with AHSA1/START domain